MRSSAHGSSKPSSLSEEATVNVGSCGIVGRCGVAGIMEGVEARGDGSWPNDPDPTPGFAKWSLTVRSIQLTSLGVTIHSRSELAAP